MKQEMYALSPPSLRRIINKKYELVMVNNFSNENKTNSYLSPQIIEHNSHYDENPSSGLERAHTCDGMKRDGIKNFGCVLFQSTKASDTTVVCAVPCKAHTMWYICSERVCNRTFIFRYPSMLRWEGIDHFIDIEGIVGDRLLSFRIWIEINPSHHEVKNC